MPSGVAALGLIDAAETTLALKVDPLSTSVAIVESDQLLLYRTLEHAGKHTLTAEQLAEDIYPSVVYCQDNFHLSVQQLLVAGLPGVFAIRAGIGAAHRLAGAGDGCPRHSRGRHQQVRGLRRGRRAAWLKAPR